MTPPSPALLSAGTRESELDEILMKSSACVICCGASKASAAAAAAVASVADHCCCCCCCRCLSSCSTHIFLKAPLGKTSICSQHGFCQWRWAGLEAFLCRFFVVVKKEEARRLRFVKRAICGFVFLFFHLRKIALIMLGCELLMLLG